MAGIEPVSHRRLVRVYVVQVFQDPDGAVYGRVTEPATMRQWVFRNLADLPRILGQAVEGPSEAPPGK
ncbi:MAG: hypothetical protein KNN16_01400 [Thermoflexus hugenholtzii]|jgi:hypothetical protein|uniref:hypothetical protein n=1 Tax=Thermoflexus TaxID=1495649 RepID=UPI001C79247D|nr:MULTISPECIES: hypothetical protein [Thermoflexus]QWK10942.1 MAG: hypothetical protein KNN16_01400 [Thermoflexus hugenholtzii]